MGILTPAVVIVEEEMGGVKDLRGNGEGVKGQFPSSGNTTLHCLVRVWSTCPGSGRGLEQRCDLMLPRAEWGGSGDFEQVGGRTAQGYRRCSGCRGGIRLYAWRWKARAGLSPKAGKTLFT